jgi:LmbE family N-acetylglucosaminyl deacetylase
MLRLVLGQADRPLDILCLGAHCDDIEIGCGGTVLRLLAERPGSTVRWVVFSSNPEREAEARASAAAFLAGAGSSKVSVHAFRESYFPQVSADIKDAFERLKAEVRPDVVFAHHRADQHQDHRVVADLVWNTFRDHLVAEYEIPKYEGDLGTPNAFFPLDDAVARRKVELILRHFPSQRGRSWFRAETFEAVMRLRAIECNAPAGWAEAFHLRKAVC